MENSIRESCVLWACYMSSYFERKDQAVFQAAPVPIGRRSNVQFYFRFVFLTLIKFHRM
jgi:hypothetical protein